MNDPGSQASLAPSQPIAAGAVSRYLERALGASALAAGIVFVAVGMGRPVWLDEANSVLIANHGFSGIVDGLSRDNNLPLYYFILSAWMRVFGDSEIAIRSLSAVFYLGGCASVFVLGKRLTGESRAGWYSAFFYGSSGLAIRQAQNIRMYSLLGLLSALSVWCWLRIFRDRDQSLRAWTWFLAVNVLGLLTHVWFLFVLVGQFAATVFFERRQLGRFLLGITAATGPFLILWGYWFWGQLHNGATSWMPRLQPLFLVLAASEFYGPAASFLLFALVAGSATRSGFRNWRWAAPPLVIFLVSLAVPLAISLVKPIYWPGRYAIIALPPLAAVLGSMLALAPPRALAAVAGLLLLAAQVTAHVAGRDLNPESQLPPGQSDRTTAMFLLAHASAGDAVVFTSLTRAPADYYFRRAGAAWRFREFSFPADNAAHLGWADLSTPAARQALLEAEAARLTQELRGFPTRFHTVWVFDSGASVGRFLTRQLDGTLTLSAVHALEGPYHKRILEYGAAASR